MRRTLAALALCAVLPVARVEATFIVILGTSDRIVIAADSRLQWEGLGTADTACKILLDSPLVLAMAGQARNKDGVTGLDGPRLWAAVKGRSESVSERARRIFEAVTAQAMFPRGNNVTAFAVVGFVATDPHVGVLDFRASPGQTHAKLAEDQFVENWGSPLVVFLGKKAGTEEAKEQLNPGISESEMVVLAERLVSQEADRRQAEVGGPIDIAVIDAKGARWVQGKVKPGCR